MKKLKVMTIFGTRPEAIKMCPVVLEMHKYPDFIQPIVAVTAQHREMLDQVLGLFSIVPDYDLNIMKQGQTLGEITTRALNGLEEVIKKVSIPVRIMIRPRGGNFIYNEMDLEQMKKSIELLNKLLKIKQ